MNIHKIRLTRRHVVIDWETPEGTFGLKLKDNPLPEFRKAVEDLSSLVLEILHLPTDYGAGLIPTGITITDKQDSQLVTIVAKKELTDCNSPFNIATPLRFLDLPKEEGSYSPPLNAKQVALVEAVINEAKRYVKGERAQGQLPLDDMDAADEEAEAVEDEADELDMGQQRQAEEAGVASTQEEKPKRGRKKRA